MRLIGLCGRSGSGKSTVASVAQELGYFCVDCDALYHELTDAPSACVSELAAEFGNEILKPDGGLNRPALASIVFEDAAKRARLNAISHRHVTRALEALLAALPEGTDVLLDAPLLFESGLNRRCARVVGVIASDEVCAARIAARDGIAPEAARARLAAQVGNAFLEEHCDILLDNTGDEASLRERARAALLALKAGD